MKIFLCVPFSSKVDENGIILPEYKAQIQSLTSGIKEFGHDYFVALEYANWSMGGESKDPSEELRHDFTEIESCDVVIALLEERVSAGVQLENGYAYAKGKKVYVYQIGKPAWSNIQFAKIAGHEITSVLDIPDFVSRAKKLIKAL